jgi:hypothetical protein
VSEKIDAVGLLFQRQGDLPEESIGLILKLADRRQPTAVRLAIANKLGESGYLPYSSFATILKLLSNDPDPQVKSATDAIYKQIMEPVAQISRHLREMAQSITVPQFALPNAALRQLQDSIAVITKRAILPQMAARNLIEALNISGQVAEAVIRSTQLALPSYYPGVELEVIGRVYPDFEKSHAAHLSAKLASCPPGRKSWKAYQTVCRKILTHTLVPSLLEPSEETATRDRLQRRDLIFHIPYNAGDFWKLITLTYKSVALIVECKNYADPLRANQVTLSSKYFGEKKLGLFGVIICRKGLSEPAKREQERLWIQEGKMILALTDDDLVDMLRLREAGDDPLKVIDNAIMLFRQSL